jgi:phenylalanyl-tRNA synthetase alpha subunit
MLPEIPPSTLLSRQESEKEQAHRRKLVYKWYKHYAKPTRANMYSIVDFYANLEDSGIKRQDVDLLPWNIEGTEVIKEAMKSKKEKKKDKKEKKNLEETEVIKKEAIQLKSLKRKTEKKVKKKDKQEKQKDKKAEFEAEAAHVSPKSTISSIGAWPAQYCIDELGEGKLYALSPMPKETDAGL